MFGKAQRARVQKLFTHRQLHDAANFDEAMFARKRHFGVWDERFAQSGAEPGALATFARDGFSARQGAKAARAIFALLVGLNLGPGDRFPSSKREPGLLILTAMQGQNS